WNAHAAKLAINRLADHLRSARLITPIFWPDMKGLAHFGYGLGTHMSEATHRGSSKYGARRSLINVFNQIECGRRQGVYDFCDPMDVKRSSAVIFIAIL